MTHRHEDETPDQYSQEIWDARYAESTRIWSGNPNPRLVEHASSLQPGTALDVGAGEGADAVWLAGHGWQVTAIDISAVALERTASHAAAAGLGDRVTTLRHDLLGDAPVPGSYDLVSAQFWHPPPERFTESFRAIAAAVGPGGTLLVVAHHPDDLATGVRRPHGSPDRLFGPEKLVAVLPPADWEVLVAEAPTRDFETDDGTVTVRDSVVLARGR